MFFRNSEGVAKGYAIRRMLTQPFQGCVLKTFGRVFPGLPKRNPGLELANAFSVLHFLIAQNQVTMLMLNSRLILRIRNAHHHYSNGRSFIIVRACHRS